jgi:hypothetical protein
MQLPIPNKYPWTDSPLYDTPPTTMPWVYVFSLAGHHTCGPGAPVVEPQPDPQSPGLRCPAELELYNINLDSIEIHVIPLNFGLFFVFLVGMLMDT